MLSGPSLVFLEQLKVLVDIKINIIYPYKFCCSESQRHHGVFLVPFSSNSQDCAAKKSQRQKKLRVKHKPAQKRLQKILKWHIQHLAFLALLAPMCTIWMVFIIPWA